MSPSNGAWHDGDPIFERELTVLAGPLGPPTDAERARQSEHFAAQCRRHADHYETDDATIDGFVNGNYWLRRQSRASAEIGTFSNGFWFGLNWDDAVQWATNLGEPRPDVIFGPLLPPEGYYRLPRWKHLVGLE